MMIGISFVTISNYLVRALDAAFYPVYTIYKICGLRNT